MLNVGEDCPYYDFGNHKTAKLVFNAAGDVETIAGPWGEKYRKQGDTAETNPSPFDGIFNPNYLGGTLEFDVNVSNVDCNCAAGVFLVTLDDNDCNQGEYESSSRPQCPQISVMKAN